MERTAYPIEIKLKAILESFQQDTTIEQVCQQFGVSRAQLYRWRLAFLDKRDPKQKVQAQGNAPEESPDDLKKIIRELTLQNDILKKAQGLLGN